MPPRKTKSKKKIAIEEAAKFCPPMKDGYGAHWHVLIWIVIVTVLLSSVTMIYATFAFTSQLPEANSLKMDNQLQSDIQNVNNRLDLIEGEIQKLRTDLKSANEMQIEAATTTQ